MSKFTGPDPLGRYLTNGEDFILCEPLEFFLSKQEGVGESIVVPAGFITDFASIPRIVQLFLPNSIGRRAAIVHDYLYRSRGIKNKFTRKQSDQIFLDALEVLGVRKTRRYLLYFGVRIGGWLPWSINK